MAIASCRRYLRQRSFRAKCAVSFRVHSIGHPEGLLQMFAEAPPRRRAPALKVRVQAAFDRRLRPSWGQQQASLIVNQV